MLNGKELTADEDALEAMAFQVARGELLKDKIAQFFSCSCTDVGE